MKDQGNEASLCLGLEIRHWNPSPSRAFLLAPAPGSACPDLSTPCFLFRLISSLPVGGGQVMGQQLKPCLLWNIEGGGVQEDTHTSHL